MEKRSDNILAELQVLLVRNAPRLRAVIRNTIPAAQRRLLCADDVLQEVWLTARKCAGRLRLERVADFESWLVTVALNQTRDLLRLATGIRRGGRPKPLGEAAVAGNSSSVDELWEYVQSPQLSPSRVMSRRERSDALHVALSWLKTEQRDVLLLQFIQGLTNPQIADRLGISITAVNGLAFRAKKSLRRELRSSAHYFTDGTETDTQTDDDG